MSTRTTSAFAAWIRRVTGSVEATGKVAQVCTVRATLVLSTRTCRTALCSLSDATITTESSGMLPLLPLPTHHLRKLNQTPKLIAQPVIICRRWPASWGQTSPCSGTAPDSQGQGETGCWARSGAQCIAPLTPSCSSADCGCGTDSPGSEYRQGRGSCCKGRLRG